MSTTVDPSGTELDMDTITAALHCPDPLTRVTSLLGKSLGTSITEVMGQLHWAEEEITAARARHPEHEARLWHSFSLLSPTHPRMSTEFVFRSHAAELLDRVAGSEDTRPGTCAEVACVMLGVATATPITPAAFGLVARMWRDAGFPAVEEFDADGAHERLYRDHIDEHETWARAKIARPERRLGAITCGGRHHGDPVDCPFAEPVLALQL